MEQYFLKFISPRKRIQLSSGLLVALLLFSSLIIFNPVKVARAEEEEWDDPEELVITSDIEIETTTKVTARGKIIIMNGATLKVHGKLLCKPNEGEPAEMAGIQIMDGTLIIDGYLSRIGRVEIDTTRPEGIPPEEMAGITIQRGEVELRYGAINRTDDSSNFFVITTGNEGSFTTLGDSVSSNVIDGINGFEISSDGYTLENVTIKNFNQTAVTLNGMSFERGNVTIKNVKIKGSGSNQVGLYFNQFPQAPGMIGYNFENIRIESSVGITANGGSEPILLKDIILSQYDTGVNASGGVKLIFLNTNISSTQATYDIVISGSSEVILVDSKLRDNVNYLLDLAQADPYKGKLEFATFINVGVKNQFGEPVPNATIWVNGTFKAEMEQPQPMEQMIYPFIPFNPQEFKTITNESGILSNVVVILNDTHKKENEEKEKQSYYPHKVYASLYDAENYTEKDKPDEITTETEWVNVTLPLYPDMYIDTENITLSKEKPPAGVNIPPLYIYANIHNKGNYTTTCNVSFFYSPVNETHNLTFIGNQSILVPAKENGTAQTIWNTTQNMTGKWRIHVNVTEAKGEFNYTYNNASKIVELIMPRPNLTISEIESSLLPIVDGDIPTIQFNLSNVGEATVGDANITVYYSRQGKNVSWNESTSNLTNATYLTKLNLGRYLPSRYQYWLNESFVYYTFLNFSWNTTDLANDSSKPNLSEPFWNYTLYFVLEYNNTINSSDISGDNLTLYISNQTFSIYKYYDVFAEVDNNISFINPDRPETSFNVSVLNTGRAFDNITVAATLWTSNETNADNWHYSFHLLRDGNWMNFSEDVDVLSLQGGEMENLYVNISATKVDNEILGEPGEYVYLNLTFNSTGNGSKFLNLSLLVVNGRGDLEPIVVEFYRADGVRADRTNKSQYNKRSLIINETSTIRVKIQNIGNATVYLPFVVGVKDLTQNIWVGNVTHTSPIKRLQVSWVEISYNFSDYSYANMVHEFEIYVDLGDKVNESNELNNKRTDRIYIKDETPTDDYLFKGNAFSWDGITKVENASVKVKNVRTGVEYTNSTDENGYFTVVVPKEEYSERDRFKIDLSVEDVNNEHYPLRDWLLTEPIYSEDNVTSEDFILLADGVDLALYRRYEHNISIYRKDGERTDTPIVDEEVTIEFYVANRGRNSTKANYTVRIDGVMVEEVENMSFPTWRRLTRITFSHTFTTVGEGHSIRVWVNSSEDDYGWNNATARTGITVKGKETNADYFVSGVIYESDAVTPASFADVVIKNLRTNQTISFKADKDGRFENKNLRTMAEGYQEGDEIEVFAKTEGGSGNLTFYAYSEDGGKNITLIFAKFDVSLVVADNEKEVKPGSTGSYLLEITNLGNREDTIKLEMKSESGRDWGHLSTTKVILRPGEKAKVYLNVSVPNDALAGVMENITIRAITNYGNGPVEDKRTTYTTVAQVYLLNVEVLAPTDLTGLPEETLKYTVRVTNRGNGEDLILLGVNDTFGWDVKFSENAFLLDNKGDYNNVTVSVTIPKGETYLTKRAFFIKARSSGGVFFYSQNSMNATVELLQDALLEQVTPDQMGGPGEVLTYQIDVINKGNRDNQDFTLRVRRDIERSSAEGDVKFDPTFSSSTTTLTLDKGETKSVTVYVKPSTRARAREVLVAKVEVTSPTLVHPQTIYISTTIDLKMDAPTLARDDQQTKSILPGKTETFNFTVTNNINDVDTISFDIDNSNPKEFEVEMNSLTVAGSSSRDVTLTVKALMSAHKGSEAVIRVSAVSALDYQLRSEQVEVRVRVEEDIYGYTLDYHSPFLVVTLGETKTYTFDITRTGKNSIISQYSAVYLVSLIYSDIDWEISSQDTIIFPAGKDSSTVTITVTIPEDTKSPYTNKTISVRVQSLENPSLGYEELALKILLNRRPVINTPRIEYGGERINLNEDVVYYDTEYNFTADLGPDNDEIENEYKEYYWDWGDLSTSEGSTVTHSFARPDQYTITLTVMEWDSEERNELYSVNTTKFMFVAENEKPDFKVKVSEEKDKYPKGIPINFEIFDVKDEEPSAIFYTWNFGDGTIENTKDLKVNHTYARGGTYTLNVRAEDKFGKSFSREFKVTIYNEKPEAAFIMMIGDKSSTTKLEIQEGDEVSFDARASQDPDKYDIIVSYVWNFGDGTNGTGQTPTHIYKKKGTYNVTLTVYDQEGESNIISAEVVVKEKKEEPPFYFWLFIAIIFVMVAVIAIVAVSPNLMAKITGADKLDIARIIREKIEEKFEEFSPEMVPQVLQKEQIVGERGLEETPPSPTETTLPAEGVTQYCINCGAKLEKGAFFCTECGFRVG